ncbi:MAG: DUF3299 domain-containing protein [Bacteroidota bacterium]
MRALSLFVLAFVLVALPAQAQQAINWDTLAQVELTRQDGRFIPDFAPEVDQLDGQRVAIQGFIFPIQQTLEQSHFVLIAFPLADCFYCLPGASESMIEVKASQPVEFTYDPVTITGTLEVLESDPMGMYYRLTDAGPGS